MDQQGFYVDPQQQQQQQQQQPPQQQYGAPQTTPMQPPPLTPGYGHSQHQHQQQQQFAPPFDSSAFQNPLVTSAVSYAAQQHLGDVSERMQGFVNVNQLRYYFDVDNRYVALKLRLLLFPFLQKEWERGIKDDKMMTPREDVKSPDLYIPTMALVTYILLVSYIMGMNGLFNAEQLSVLCSSTLGVLVFENVVAKLASFLFGIPAPLYDTMAFTSYKFVSLIVVLIVALITRSSFVYYLVFAWLALALFYFTFRSLSAMTPSAPGKLFAAGFAGAEVLVALLLLVFGLGMDVAEEAADVVAD